MMEEIYKNYLLTSNIHNRLKNHCAIRWEVMRKVKNGWEGTHAVIENVEGNISDDRALVHGMQKAREYVDRSLH
ncbi:hypothetical protein KTR10_00445 [Candidatus Kaiserbacteria bacterium]|nr:hypothetical protein [Candidatus Kaiserbacteria bacterium]